MDDLRPFAEVDASALRWTRIDGELRSFLLRAGDVPVARLVFPHATGSLAHGATSDRRLTMKRGGFLLPHVSVRSDPDGADLARLAAHLQGATLDVGRTGHYRVHRAGILVPAWQVADAHATPLIDLEPVAESRHLVGGVATVSPLGLRSPDLPLLLLTAWYFVVLAWFEDEALAASRAVLSAVSDQ